MYDGSHCNSLSDRQHSDCQISSAEASHGTTTPKRQTSNHCGPAVRSVVINRAEGVLVKRPESPKTQGASAKSSEHHALWNAPAC